MDFKLDSQYKPTGDQPQAIDQLAQGVDDGAKAQTLLGVTGSGKTFTMANVITRVKRPTLILSHNKTLAAQLYGEFKQFFPENSVQYFVSYYDYYQPEAYIPSVDKYIEKDLMINDEIERLRLATVSALLSGRRDVIVVSSVSCLFGMGNPEDFNANVIDIRVGQKIARNAFLRHLAEALYSRNEIELNSGNFRVKGDTVDIRIECDKDESSTMTVSAAVLNGERFARGYEILSASQLNLTKFRSTLVEGTIDCDRDGLLYTSVPQNGNWSVKVDGKPAEIKLVGDCMVAVNLTKGVHNVRLMYHNAAFSLG